MTDRTAQQRMRSIIVKMFPWLPGIVSVAGTKGKGLAIRAAGGLLHLAGGPGDPAVVRVGDKAGSCFVQVDPSDAAGTGLKFTNANGASVVIPITFVGGAVVVGPAVPPGQFELIVNNSEGSEKVTCA